MPNKKDAKSKSANDSHALEKRVDAMMDPRLPDAPKPAQPAPEKLLPLESIPALEAAEVPGTAPEVPGKILKQIDTAKPEPQPPTEPPVKPAPVPEVVAPLAKESQEFPTEPEPALPPEPEAEQPPAPDNIDDDASLDDDATDEAVDDIAAKESDAVLAAEDAATKQVSKKPAKSSTGWKAKLAALAKNKWTWIGLGVLLIIIFALPVTRYKILGLAIKKSVTISVVDSKTATPVSNAAITIAGKAAKTNADGKAQLSVPVGDTTLKVVKQYYKIYSASYFVGFKSSASPKVLLIATGRQVPVTVLNKISGKPLAGAEIKVLGTTAKTNSHGQAVVVLPASATTDSATITLNGYNTAKANLQITVSATSANSIQLTPAGEVYFLSNLNGTIDVVKTNLDGTNRQTVLAGTGHEDPNTTSLLASRDWRYLALEAQRDGSGRPAMYLIDTSNDKLTQFDTSNSSFTPIGWYAHDFVYDLESNTIPQSQTGHEVLKSYDADHLQLNQLDQTQSEGTTSSYGYQNFSNFYLLDNLLTYNTQWYTFDNTGTNYDISSKSDTIRGVQPNGQNKKDYQSFAANQVSYIQAALYQPQAVYYAVHNADGVQITYYNFQNGAATQDSTIGASSFAQAYPTYLVSPSGNQTFWTDLRDGKNTLLVGDPAAQNPKTIASLSVYTPYGWYSDNYVLVSQNDSELYVMPASGLGSSKQPLKVTDYYKSPQTHPGYGYGYGGL